MDSGQRLPTTVLEPGRRLPVAFCVRPTASGKTFLVLQWLIEQISLNEKRVAVYLAPTRALVAEIEANLVSLLGAGSGNEVSSLPIREKHDKAHEGGPRAILVLTQERMHLLANAIGGGFKVDLLVVDEAHKIGDNQRGVILEDAIERASRSNPALKLVFISPATQNPQELWMLPRELSPRRSRAMSQPSCRT